MYSGEDDNSLLLRLADTEIIATPLQIEREELPSSLIIRPLGIFLTSKSLSTLSTEQVLALLSDQVALGGGSGSAQLLARPVNLTWLNDESIILLYDNIDDTTTSFLFLSGKRVDLEETNEEKLLELHEFPSLEADLAFWGRMALESDVVAKNSASKSEYYRNNTRPSPYSNSRPNGKWSRNMEGGNNAGNRRGGGRRERSDVSNSSGSKSQTAQELDDELDAYLKGKDAGVQKS